MSAPEGFSHSLHLYPSGILFDPFRPDPKLIRIDDVAHGLACINRFGGHLTEPYNVAHHSILVAQLCPERPLWALLHEVAEALSGLGDVCGPTKRHPSLNATIKRIEHGIEAAAAETFHLPPGFASDPSVKRADRLVYAWEDRDLRGGIDDDAWVHDLRPHLPQERIRPMGWREAEYVFLEVFHRLTGGAS